MIHKMLTLAEQLRHTPFPEVAQAIRDRRGAILRQWRTLVLEALPHIDRKTITEFENDIRALLALVADSLESDDERGVAAVFDEAPRHGLDRFRQQYELTDMLTEQRILRGVTILEIEGALCRPIAATEAASIHAIIDVMFQQGTLMMVKKQQEQLREAAEAELKFLSFLSHDLNNNLFAISSSLGALNRKLGASQQFEEAHSVLETALRTIRHTTDGMRRLLRLERLRRSDAASTIAEVKLHEKFSRIAHLFNEHAMARGIRLSVEVDADATCAADPDLLYLILQNIVGNAVKHSDAGGEVRLTARREKADGRECWRLSVADQGPGIGHDRLESVVDTLNRGEAMGAPGIGLGLAIASQAASLLDARIEVSTRTGGPEQGTTFHIILHDAPAPGA